MCVNFNSGLRTDFQSDLRIKKIDRPQLIDTNLEVPEINVETPDLPSPDLKSIKLESGALTNTLMRQGEGIGNEVSRLARDLKNVTRTASNIRSEVSGQVNTGLRSVNRIVSQEVSNVDNALRSQIDSLKEDTMSLVDGTQLSSLRENLGIGSDSLVVNQSAEILRNINQAQSQIENLQSQVADLVRDGQTRLANRLQTKLVNLTTSLQGAANDFNSLLAENGVSVGLRDNKLNVSYQTSNENFDFEVTGNQSWVEAKTQVSVNDLLIQAKANPGNVSVRMKASDFEAAVSSSPNSLSGSLVVNAEDAKLALDAALSRSDLSVSARASLENLQAELNIDNGSVSGKVSFTTDQLQTLMAYSPNKGFEVELKLDTDNVDGFLAASSNGNFSSGFEFMVGDEFRGNFQISPSDLMANITNQDGSVMFELGTDMEMFDTSVFQAPVNAPDAEVRGMNADIGARLTVRHNLF